MDFQEAMERQTKKYLEQHPDLESRPDGGAGYAFEDLCGYYLENGPWGLQNRAAICKWSDPKNPLLKFIGDEDKYLSFQDKGCDLVVQTDDGSYYMVQCKYYPNSALTLDGAHLANIFPLASRCHVPDDHIIFCYIAAQVSSNAQEVLSSPHICFTEEALTNPDFDYGPLFGKKKRPSKTLWP